MNTSSTLNDNFTQRNNFFARGRYGDIGCYGDADASGDNYGDSQGCGSSFSGLLGYKKGGPCLGDDVGPVCKFDDDFGLRSYGNRERFPDKDGEE